MVTARSENHPYLQKLGASELIDYAQTDFANAIHTAHPQGIDAVLDCVGGETAARSVEVLRENGRLVTIVDLEEVIPTHRIDTHLLYFRPDGRQLAELTKLVDNGQIISGSVNRPGCNRIFPQGFQGATKRTTNTYQFAVGGHYDAGPLLITADLARTHSRFDLRTESVDYFVNTNNFTVNWFTGRPGGTRARSRIPSSIRAIMSSVSRGVRAGSAVTPQRRATDRRAASSGMKA